MTIKQRPAKPAGPTEIEFPGRMHPVLAILAFLPMMMIILIAMALMVEDRPPIALIGLLIAVLGCCCMLSWTAVQTMAGGKLELAPEGLKIHRFFGEETYDWHEIDACKATTATGTFGDNALVESDERVGLGLFLRNSTRVREHDLDPDVVICAADKIDVQGMIRIASKVEAALKRSRAPGALSPIQPAPPPAAAAAAVAGARRDGQQSSNPRPARKKRAPADPVAAFRQRAAAGRNAK